MHSLSALRSRLIFVLAAVPLLVSSAAIAQIPGLTNTAPSKAETSAKAETRESVEQTHARIQKLFAEARKQSELPPQPIPAGIEPREAAELREAQLKLVLAYDIYLRTLDQLEPAQAARQAAETREREWTSFDSPPPYSILLLDELRDDADTARVRVAVLEAGASRLKIDVQRIQDELRRADEDTRRSAEALASASTPEEKTRAAWRLNLARAKARTAGVAATAAGAVTKSRDDDLATRKAELTLLERQIAVATPNTAFTEADVATARKRIEDKVVDVRREIAGIEAQMGQRLRERDAAKDALARTLADDQATQPERAIAQARLDAADAWVDALRNQSDALQGFVVLGGQGAAAWTTRYALMHDSDPEANRIAAAKLREIAQRSASWKAYTDSLVREAREKMNDVEGELSTADLPPAALRYGQDALAARRGALLARERLQNALDTALRQLDRWVGDLAAVEEKRDFRGRVIDGWLAARDAARKVWNLELFAVEDSAVADGQTITVSRGVTVGKSVGAVLIFLLGYWAIAAVTRRIERRLVARGSDVGKARTARRWVLALSGLLLLLLTLNLARIPFTVFAFLGGALAIGVGFGTQTLIKNLVSGMVMLLERQVRVGDTVELDNITGTVTEVNLRSSIVRGFDGVEAIVPNSVFIENKVTNWTHTDRKVRRVIKVGVAYGSPTRETADILADCAKRHGLVLGDPAPLVIFENFGDDALVFALYIWLDLRPGVNSMQVASDLRFMIEKSFADAGIAVAYPQRDVHLDSAKPLRVEVVREQKPDQPA
jgi:potassium-dependent mechanosensitive channel